MLQPQSTPTNDPSRNRAAFARRVLVTINAWLASRHAPRVAAIAVPLICGLYSLWLGADANWDLTNYHLYNPFAWLNGKSALDLAPAGLQTYFNPLLDLPFYALNQVLPPALVGFLMGTVQGLGFVLIFKIARRCLSDTQAGSRQRGALIIAGAGCLTSAFLSELGNSMGDNLTALLVLAGLNLVLSGWHRLLQPHQRSFGLIIAAGALTGLAAGLKLTNAVYALAMCASLLVYPAVLGTRARLAVTFGAGVAIGFGAGAGYWMLHLWQTFGNPLYPQFSTLFPSALTRTVASVDTRWGPHGWLEALLFPFVFALHPGRVGETEIHQVIWPLVYVLFWAWAAQRLATRTARPGHENLRPEALLVVTFVVLGFILWLTVFGVYRYLVAIEVLAPLVATVLIGALFREARARRLTIWALGVATAVVVLGGARTWGHEGWAHDLDFAEMPQLSAPSQTTVLIYSPINAWAWLATLFPRSVSFTQIESSFPESPAFAERIRHLASTRDGPIFAVVDGVYDKRAESVLATSGLLSHTGMTHSAEGCSALKWAVARFHLHATVVDGLDPGQCALAEATEDVRDVVAENRALVAQAMPVYQRYGFALQPAQCETFKAGIGRGSTRYQWCALQPIGN